MSKIDCSNCKYYDFNACDGVDWCKLNHEETGICGNCDREFEDLEEATTHYDALVEENNTFLMENSKMAGEIKDLQSQLAEKDKEIEKLEEQLKNAIVPRFRTYQPIFYITQYYTSTKGNPEYDIISDKYYVAENENEIILGWDYAKDFNQRKYYYVRKDWVFTTKEEAEQKLNELKGKVEDDTNKQ